MNEPHKSAEEDRENQAKPLILFILGGPGSGKGTQCEKMVKEWGFNHISAGDLLREEINSGSEQAGQISNYIKEGKLVPGDMIVDLLKKRVLGIIASSAKKERKVILIDGFPRSKENLDSWNQKKMAEICDDKYLLYFECSIEAMQQRIMERGKTSGRLDDNAETIKKRLQTN